MLATTLGRHVRDCSFDDLEKSLLYAFTGDITGNRRVVALAAHLVDFIDVDDAALCAIDIVISVLQKLNNDVLNVFTNVTRLGQSRCVSNSEMAP